MIMPMEWPCQQFGIRGRFHVLPCGTFQIGKLMLLYNLHSGIQPSSSFTRIRVLVFHSRRSCTTNIRMHQLHVLDPCNIHVTKKFYPTYSSASDCLWQYNSKLAARIARNNLIGCVKPTKRRRILLKGGKIPKILRCSISITEVVHNIRTRMS